MKKIIFLSLSSIMLLVLVQCKPKVDNQDKSKTENQELKKEVENPDLHQIVVKEILKASAYNYLLVTENDKEYWMAIPLSDVEVGKTYTYIGGVEMKNFESKDLKRTFDSVFFVEGVMDPNAKPETSVKEEIVDKTTKTELSKGITLHQGAISVHDLFLDKDKMEGKTVILTGKVVKVLPEIMNKTWVHLQDGSSFEGRNDITITTLEKVKAEDIVTFKGKVALSKDLGAGYKYDILIENATILK